MIPGNSASLGFSEKYGFCRYGAHHRCAHDDETSHAPMLAEYEPIERTLEARRILHPDVRQEERRRQPDADRGGQRHHAPVARLLPKPRVTPRKIVPSATMPPAKIP